MFFVSFRRAVEVPENGHQDKAKDAGKCSEGIGIGCAAEPVGEGEVLDVFAIEIKQCGNGTVVDDVEQGRDDDIAGLVVDDAEQYANREGIDALCEVEVDGAESQG